MRSFIFNIVALVALFITAIGCSVEGSPGGGDDAVGSVSSNLTWTGADGTPGTAIYAFVGTVQLTCDDSAYCDTEVRAMSTTAMDSSITFEDVPLGPYSVSIWDAPTGPTDLIPGWNITLSGPVPPMPTPYCTYAGDRIDFLGCRLYDVDPDPVPVRANTNTDVLLSFRFYFADGTEWDAFSMGRVTVSFAATSHTSCGDTLEDCTMSGRVCASIDGGDDQCYAPCVLSNSMIGGGPVPPFLPAAVPCAGTCTLVDCAPGDPMCPPPPGPALPGSGYWGVTLDRGLCVDD